MGDRRSRPERGTAKRAADGKNRRGCGRRPTKRCKARRGVYAVLVNGRPRLAKVKDIKLRGLSFRAVAGRGDKGPHGVLKIRPAGKGLFSDDPPYRPVSDGKIESDPAFRSVMMRRMNVAFTFGDLPHRQLSLLDEFILTHTMGEA